MLHQVGVSFVLYYDARKHKIKKKLCEYIIVFQALIFSVVVVSANHGFLQGLQVKGQVQLRTGHKGQDEE